MTSAAPRLQLSLRPRPSTPSHAASLLASAIALCTLGLSAACASAAPMNPKQVSVQMFQWNWDDIATECTQWLGPKGFGAVQISPPGASKVANGWWAVYQPVNHASLSSRFGDAAKFANMVTACHNAGVRVYADIVVNQLADGSGTATDGSTWDAGTLRYPRFSANDFHGNCTIAQGDYSSPAGRGNVMNCRLGGLPDLATESTYVQGEISNYLKTLLGLGVDGFRIDAAKHMPASAWGSIMANVRQAYPQTKLGEPIWFTQEVIPDGGVNMGDYTPLGTVNEFRFTYLMRDAFRGQNGQTLSSIPAAMGSWGNWGGSWGFLQPQSATVFVNNWDTERDGSSMTAANFSAGAVNDTVGTKRYTLANLFMLAQGYGEAQLHSGFRFSNKDGDRPAASPYSNGQPQINVNWDFVHRWSDIAAMVKFRNDTAGQAQTNWTTGDSHQVAFSRGQTGFVALNNSASAWNTSLFTNLPAGSYCDLITGGRNSAGTACVGTTVTVGSNGYASVNLPANNGGATPALAILTTQKLGAGGGTGPGCTVTFSVGNANTSWGQNLYVVGNQTVLGNWTPAQGHALTIQGSGANATWSGAITLPASTAIQYKYVKWNGSTATWEGNQATASGNREFASCTAGASLSRNDGSFKM